MALLTVEKLKDRLALEGVDYDLTDANLELLLNNVVIELMGDTNCPINPVNHKKIIREFSSDMLELDYYPIKGISSLKIGSLNFSSDDFVLDDTLGILYFDSVHTGMLVCEYCCQIKDGDINNVINPLLFDMIKYRLTSGFGTTGVMSSVKEGDVQVNYDVTSSLGNLIQARINNLKSNYSIRIKVL